MTSLSLPPSDVHSVGAVVLVLTVKIEPLSESLWSGFIIDGFLCLIVQCRWFTFSLLRKLNSKQEVSHLIDQINDTETMRWNEKEEGEVKKQKLRTSIVLDSSRLTLTSQRLEKVHSNQRPSTCRETIITAVLARNALHHSRNWSVPADPQYSTSWLIWLVQIAWRNVKV